MKIDFDSQVIELNEEKYSESMWHKAMPLPYKIVNSKADEISGKVQVLKSEIDALKGRIKHELLLTEKITNDLKAKSGDRTKRGSNEIKELERQWDTTENNIKVFNGMIEPKEAEIRNLMAEEAETEEAARKEIELDFAEKIKPVAYSVLAKCLEAAQSFNELFALHKTLISLHKEGRSKVDFGRISVNPIDLPDVFREQIEKYCNGIITGAHELLEGERP